jgi:hypothetical protein
MPVVGSKTDAKNETVVNRNNTMRGTMIIMTPSTTNLTDSAPLKEGAMEESKHFSMTSKGCVGL